MKKILLIFFLFLFGDIHGYLYAQNKDIDYSLSKYYVKVTAGYGIGTNAPYEQSYDNNKNLILTSAKPGNGFYSGAAIGYQYNSNLGTELGFGYEYGFKNDIPENATWYRGNMLQTVPALVFSSKAGIFSPYIRAGLIIGVPEVVMDQYGNGQTFILHGGLATGIQGALGCSVPLRNKRWTVFAEACFNDIGYLPQKGSVLAETSGGVNQLPYIDENLKETVYKKSFNPGVNTNNPNQPYTAPEIKQPFNAFVLNAGVKLNIGTMPVNAVDDFVSQHMLVRLNAGYGIATNGDLYTETGTNIKSINVSYGTGLNVGGGIAYMFNKTIGFDLGANYVSGTGIKADNGSTISPNQYENYSVKSANGNMFDVIPSLVIATHIHKLMPYARLGMILGSGNVYFNTENPRAYLKGSSSTYDRQSTERFYGGLSSGYSVTVGAAYSLSYRYDLFAEACFNNVYFIPEKGQIIKDNYNNVSNLSDENIGDKYFIFEPYVYPYSFQSINSPNYQSQVEFSFNSCVINVGIRMWFKGW